MAKTSIKSWTAKCISDQTGCLIVVTGGNGVLGFEAAMQSYVMALIQNA